MDKMNSNTDNNKAENKGGHGPAVMYIIIVGVFFLAMTTVFLAFPRSRYSVLEKRDLAEFPDVNKIKENPGKFTADVSSWFSDTEPFRDDFMTLSMNIRGAMKADFRSDEDAVSFRPADVAANATSSGDMTKSDNDAIEKSDTVSSETVTEEDEDGDDINDGKAKLGSSGTIIIGKGENVRALMAFGGTAKGGGGYVDLLNTLADVFPSQKVYAIVAPLATEFYLPAKAAKASNPQKPFIYSIRDRLSPKVKFVDVYDELRKHRKEDIYLRTDHHWSPLGGYYAAKKLAETAGVPFKGLDAYDTNVLKKFVGTMYSYSKDISVKNAPEDFIYYTPNQVSYDAEFVSYFLNKNFKIIRETKPYKSSFFKKFKDGSGNAYLTFMGSDQAFVKVKTSTPGNRKVLVIKDSYGNAVPGNLFYSFNEVHVIDFRYFTHNLKDYVAKNGITDIVVCFNVFNAYSNGSAAKVKKMLTQGDGIPASTSGNNAGLKSKNDASSDKKDVSVDTKEDSDETNVPNNPVNPTEPESEKTVPTENPVQPEKSQTPETHENK